MNDILTILITIAMIYLTFKALSVSPAKVILMGMTFYIGYNVYSQINIGLTTGEAIANTMTLPIAILFLASWMTTLSQKD